jgi:3-hydroxyisobutyrate dehydrogenase-like beta-hydroxyacid dehydrogenase
MAGSVGFIGLGNMGRPMSLNLVKHGFPLIVHDIDPAKVEPLRARGATVADSPEGVAAGADRTICMVETTAQAETVIAGPRGIVRTAKPGHIVVCMSTIDPFAARRLADTLAKSGVAMLDAPVSGGTTGAEAATIAIMVGGDKKVFDDALPVLQSFSANVIHMGGLGSGTVAKLVNNMLSFCNMAALTEGMMLGTGYGLDPEKLLHVISTSSGNSNAIKNFTLRALPGKYAPPSFALDLAYKDLHLALELGDELGVPLSQGAATHNLQRLAKGMGFGPDDSTSVLRVYESMLGRKVKS